MLYWLAVKKSPVPFWRFPATVMKNLYVALQNRSYQIRIGNGVLQQAGQLLKHSHHGRSLVVLSNSKVMSLHGDQLLRSLEQARFSVQSILVPDGERFKNLCTVESIYRRLVRLKADRRTLLIAFGGGVIGDMAGFVAATYLRGVPFVQIPTTLLGQIDSAIGGKTGVNLDEGKNLVGAFYQPELVLSDPLLLLTLPRREFLSGIYEALKYGIIWDAGLFRLISRKHQRFPQEDQKSLERVITACAAIKAEVVSKDERESELRMVLNFGHTIGHALEAATGYRRFTHGEAVGHGMIMATHLAARLNKMDPEEGRLVQKVIASVSCLPSVRDLETRRLLRHLQSDKKVLNRQIRFVIPRSIGTTEILSDTPVELLKDVISAYIRRGPDVFPC